MPKVGAKSESVQRIGQKAIHEGLKIGQKFVKKASSKPVVLEPEFMESLKKLKF